MTFSTRRPRRLGRAAVLAFAGAALVAGCGSGTTGAASGTSAAPSSAASASTTASKAATTAGQKLTMAEVQKHNSATSCWAVVDGAIYDLTAWISKHPGGPDRIKALCGTDATKQFADQHGKAAPSGKPQMRLADFKLGPLEK